MRHILLDANVIILCAVRCPHLTASRETWCQVGAPDTT